MGVEGEYYDGPCKLLELPHYVLRILFSYVDATSLYHLSLTCNYLKEFIEDPSFWRYVDARKDPNAFQKLHYCSNRVHERTTHLLLRGNMNIFDLPNNFFEKIRPFQNLKVLALEDLKLQGSKVALKDFPSGLEELSLRRTYVKNSTYFFQHSVRNLTKLRVLILDECSWVTCSFLLSVSKYEHLEIISIVKCLRVHINMIPYLNVAKFGCKKLKVFDCRFTGIGGEILRTFYSKESLQRFYFQSFKSSEVDYHEKIIDDSGLKTKKNFYPDPNTAISIADIHLCEYVATSAKPRDEVEEVFDSLLYQDPYPKCTCGSGSSNENNLCPDLEFFDDDMVHIPSGQVEPKFVCEKHMNNLMDFPSTFRDFLLSQNSNAASVHFDTDSNSEDEENCCYIGMGTSMIIPSTHDRTPSRREEMTLPREGARNQTSARVFVFSPIRDNQAMNLGNNGSSSSSSNNTFHSLQNRSFNNPTKRRYTNSESDSDSDSCQGKKSKKDVSSELDGLSSEAQAVLVNQLVQSADEVKNRIDKIMGENGITPQMLKQTSSDSDESDSAQENTQQKNNSESLNHHATPSSSAVHSKKPQTTVSTRNHKGTSLRSANVGSASCSRSLTTTDSCSKVGTNSKKRSSLEPSNSDNSSFLRNDLSDNLSQTSRADTSDHSPSCSEIDVSSTQAPLSNFTVSKVTIKSTSTRDESTPTRFSNRTSSTRTKPECTNGGNDDEPSCSQKNDDDAPDLSETDQNFDSSSDSDDSIEDSYLTKKRKFNSTDQSKTNEKQAKQRRENPEPPQRVEPLHNNYILIENSDRRRVKKKIPLRRLSLRGYRRVTDLTLIYLAKLEIELIDLTHTSVTKQGIENFLVHNPNCRVIHPLYCTCKPSNPFSLKTI